MSVPTTWEAQSPALRRLRIHLLTSCRCRHRGPGRLLGQRRLIRCSNGQGPASGPHSHRRDLKPQERPQTQATEPLPHGRKNPGPCPRGLPPFKPRLLTMQTFWKSWPTAKGTQHPTHRMDENTRGLSGKTISQH